MKQVRIIRRDSNFQWLPLYFFLPESYINSCPTLPKIPRNLHMIDSSTEITALIESEQFINELGDAIAALAFPHFGFRGWKEDYTGYFPVWKLSYVLPLWKKHIEVVTGWGWDALLHFPKDVYIPFMPNEKADEIMAEVVKRGIAEMNWQPILDVIRKMPCEEDYEPRRSRVRIDWERKWYHSRSTRIEQVSLEECMADPTHKIHRKTVAVTDIAADVESADYWERFKARLSHKDKEILVMRANGYPYEEIAARLGYKNHSGVLKRIRVIREVYEKYEQEMQ